MLAATSRLINPSNKVKIMKRVNFNVVGLGLYAHLLGMEEQGFDDIA